MWRSYQADVLRLIATGMGAKKLPKFEELLGEANTEPAMTQEQVMEKRQTLLEKLNAG